MSYQYIAIISCISGNAVLSEGEAEISVFAAQIGQSSSNTICQPHGGHLCPLCQLAMQMWEWCLAHQIAIHAEYLPGIENVTADWESHH